MVEASASPPASSTPARQADPTTGSRAVPIYQTTSYQFRNTEHAANLFALRELGNIYTRIMNPTTDVLEQRIASLEGGVGRAGGQQRPRGAGMAIMTLCEAGDHIVSSSRLYGGTYNQFNYTLPRLGIEVTFVDPARSGQLRARHPPNTKLSTARRWATPTSGLSVRGVAAIAKSVHHPADDRQHLCHALPLPALRVGGQHRHPQHDQVPGRPRPGHRRRDRGRRQLRLAQRPLRQLHHARPQLPRPGLRRRGLAWGCRPSSIKARVQVLRDLGACQAPFNSWNTLTGIETLSLRMERHCANAQRVAEFLERTPAVNWVSYPGLASHPDHELAKKLSAQGRRRHPGLRHRGRRRGRPAFIDNLQLFSHLANVGDAKSLAIHPASTTHSQLTAEEMVTAGVTPDFIRLSVGLEDIEDHPVGSRPGVVHR
jgi:O-acetylhomoserine (thiol)-lyase